MNRVGFFWKFIFSGICTVGLDIYRLGEVGEVFSYLSQCLEELSKRMVNAIGGGFLISPRS